LGTETDKEREGVLGRERVDMEGVFGREIDREGLGEVVRELEMEIELGILSERLVKRESIELEWIDSGADNFMGGREIASAILLEREIGLLVGVVILDKEAFLERGAILLAEVDREEVDRGTFLLDSWKKDRVKGYPAT
jgi:uncharacterized protein YqgQ